MADFFRDNDDLQYYIDRGLDWATLTERVELGYRFEDGHRNSEEAVEFYRDVLGLVGQFAATEVAPRAAAIDRLGVSLVDGDVVFSEPLEAIFQKIRGLDLHGLCVPGSSAG